MSRSPVDTAYAIVRQAAARERIDRLVAHARAHAAVGCANDCPGLEVLLDVLDGAHRCGGRPHLTDNDLLLIATITRLAEAEGGPR